MKKVISFFALSFILAPSVMAFNYFPQNTRELDQNRVDYTYPLVITATAENEILQANGISLVLDPNEAKTYVLWHQDASWPAILKGTAVENGKVDWQSELVYSDDFKTVFIPVLEDFDVGETLEVQLAIRSYEEDFNKGAVGLDLSGDLQSEAVNYNVYEVSQVKKNDDIAPYPIHDLTHSVAEDGTVSLAWQSPPDPDFKEVHVERVIVKDGQTLGPDFLVSTYTPHYEDEDLEGVSKVTYLFSTLDTYGNFGEPVELTVDLTAPVEPFEKLLKVTFGERLHYSQSEASSAFNKIKAL